MFDTIQNIYINIRIVREYIYYYIILYNTKYYINIGIVPKFMYYYIILYK